MSEPVYIYTLSCPKTGQVRYVGVTNSPHVRVIQHESSPSNKAKQEWIGNLIKAGFAPLMVVIERVDDGSHFQKECAWVRHFQDLGCDLLNIQTTRQVEKIRKTQLERLIEGVRTDVYKMLEDDARAKGEIE